MPAGLDGDLEGKRIVVQGLGNVGYHAAKLLSEEDGAQVIAIIKHDGAIVNPEGIHVEEAYYHKCSNGSFKGFAGAEFVEDGQKVLEMECDILIPAAVEGVISEANAPNIQAKLIAEGGQRPGHLRGRPHPAQPRHRHPARCLSERRWCSGLLLRMDS